MKGLILAGGHGTRLRPLTFTGNKHMIPIANQPILFYGLRHLANAGIRDVAVVLGPIEEGIRKSVGAGESFGLNVEYIVQGDPKGLAHAVLCARDFLGRDPFLMYLGDNLLQSGISQYVDRYASAKSDAVVGATPVARPQAYGIVEMSGDQIVSIEEKPAHPRSNLALIGVYLFTEAIHPIVADLAPSHRGELEITDAIWRLWKSRGRVSVLQVNGWWKDTGRPEDLLEANELVLRSMPPEEFRVEGRIQPGALVEGSVGVGTGTTIEPNATVVGPTILGSGVYVGAGSRIGPFCAVGDRAVLTHASVRRSIILEGARLEGVRVADSLVGRNVEVNSERPMDRELRLTIGDSSRVLY
ncbi:MAG: glucose-1-phosphate thymidylyltransferase [Thermoplasmata archaeon]